MKHPKHKAAYAANRIRGLTAPWRRVIAATMFAIMAAGLPSATGAATRYVWTNSPWPAQPYDAWSNAAPTIQAALNIADAGDLILVTNGVYDSGGVAIHGTMTNRVAITNAVTVQSVNGPAVTVIKGQPGVGGVCDAGAIRCAYLAPGAVLAGFTLTNGFTRDDEDWKAGEGGGGAYIDSGSVLSNCWVLGNAGYYIGGGVVCNGGGTLVACTISGNRNQRTQTYGGGVYCYQGGLIRGCLVNGNTTGLGGWGGGVFCYNGGAVQNSTIRDNQVPGENSGGGGVYCSGGGTVANCTLIGNSAPQGNGGGLYLEYSTGRNCIVYYNTAARDDNCFMATGGRMEYSCVTPDPGGTSNLTVEPQLASASHLASNSPCIGKGQPGSGTGSDIDGETWLNPPSIGCDEVVIGAVTGQLTVAIEAEGTKVAPGWTLDFTAQIEGRVGANAWSFGDGATATNQPHASHAWSATGDYAVVLWAYNESYPLGVAATVAVQVVAQPVHYVRLDNPTPSAPYTNWPTAATNIQDAVDAVDTAVCKGALVLVSNGTYGLFSQIVVAKPIRIESVAGAPATIVDGSAATRCFFVSNAYAVVDGFTIRNGYTNGDFGGGVYLFGGGTAQNCAIISNVVNNSGGGGVYCHYEGTVRNCMVGLNTAKYGGGVYCYRGGVVQNSTISNNAASSVGGGAYCDEGGTLNTCTISVNRVTANSSIGGGAYCNYGLVLDCLVSGNTAGTNSAGGGVYCDEGSVVLNSILRENEALGNSGCGGGAYVFDGTMRNCNVVSNTANCGGGVYCEDGVMSNCLFAANIAPGGGCGGGVYLGGYFDIATMLNCQVVSNRALDSGCGGGVYCDTDGIMANCVVEGNSAEGEQSVGGGVFGYGNGIIVNCAINGNLAEGAESCGGGAYCDGNTISNCTVVGNSAPQGVGGGLYLDSNTGRNCIVYYNTAASGANCFMERGGSLEYSCVTPDPGGTSNITVAPSLASLIHLATNSPCIGKGQPGSGTGTDIDGEAWQNPPGMGCDEVTIGAVTGALTATIEVEGADVAAGWNLNITARIAGMVGASAWTFGDGATATNQPCVAHAWSAPGDYDVVLWAYNESYPLGVAVTVTVHVVAQPVHYVRLDSPTPVSPYTNWTTAATNIQDAVDAAACPGALVLVSNGTYMLSTQIVVAKSIAIESVGGAAATIVDGSATTRCFFVSNTYAVVDGFTIRNGYANSEQGGGVYLFAGGTVRNCTIISNVVYNGNGGGAYIYYGGTVRNCTVSMNTAAGSGGGVSCYYGGTVRDSTISSNMGASGGGGVYLSGGGFALNCALIGNTTDYDGAGGYAANGGVIQNCAVCGNSAPIGRAGGLFCNDGVIVRNCTIIGNFARTIGGVLFGGSAQMQNSIIYYNTAESDPNWFIYGGSIAYSCVTPDPGGTSNITAEPLLASLTHLATNSPCIGKGNYACCAGVDMDGEAWLNPPSMGCDEVVLGAVTGPVTVAIEAEGTMVTTGLALNFTAQIGGRVGASGWSFDDGTTATNQPYVAHAWSAPGDYEVVLWANNESFPLGVAATVVVQVVDQAIHYVNAGNLTPSAPYTNWATAATNIQAAVDAVACKGALVLVSNGTYVLSSQIVVAKPITVRSVDGAAVTIVDGNVTTRCFYVSHTEAILDGFTIRNGQTDPWGGGVYLALGGTVRNCTIVSNVAANSGGGGVYCYYGGTVENSTICSNRAAGGQGGGVYCNQGGTVRNCALIANYSGSGGGVYCASGGTLENNLVIRNWVSIYGGGLYCSYGGTVRNCTITTNSAAFFGGGLYRDGGGLTENTIIFFNRAPSGGSNHYENGFGWTYQNCGTAPVVGSQCVASDPRFINPNANDFRLLFNSPCIEKGTNQAWMTGAVDLEGKPRILWPSVDIGAYEWAPVIAASPGPRGAINPSGNTWVFPGSNLTFAIIPDQYLGVVDVVVDGASVGPSNSYTFLNVTNGHTISATFMVTSHFDVVYVATNGLEVFPYTNWDDAARTIPEALTAATTGTLVLVSNGVYNTGGTTIHGAMTNRVAITKAVTVQSVNGPEVTRIEGQPGTGGDCGNGAIRCAYLTNGATLAGFTLNNGFTRTSGDPEKERSGGGAYCDLGGIISNCVISGNAAGTNGGGVQCYLGGLVQNSLITSNRAAVNGGGISCGNGGMVRNCRLNGNAAQRGGGVYAENNGLLQNCTIVDNSATNEFGGGVYFKGGGTAQNCIVYYNSALAGANYYTNGGGILRYSCATPDPGGTSNLTVEPQLASAGRLASNSPCIGKGSFAYSEGADIDAEAWLNPPSIGCDEVVIGAVTGSLVVAIEAEDTVVTPDCNLAFTAQIEGRVGVSAWDFGDGVVASNQPFAFHAWDATGDYAVVLWAYNESYPLGVAATVLVQVVAQPVHYVMAANSTPLAPYTNWATAATNIQNAVDAAVCKGALVLVSNGIYGVSTQIDLVKPVTVRSLAGPVQTIVDGNNATRCFLLSDSRAVVDGFTIKKGRSTFGGGVYCFGGGTVQNCVISSNSTPTGNGGAAYCYGGGMLQNCLVYSNSASAGGGVYCHAGGTIQSCTISSNRAAYGGGVYTTNGGEVVNTILYFNNVTTTGTNFYDRGSGGTYANCGTWPAIGVNCVTNDPLFVNRNVRNYRLQDWSACIEKGTNQTWMSGAADLDGRPRILWPSVDIGAYEWTPIISSSNGLNGTMLPAGVVELYPGSNQTYTMIPDQHYGVADVVVDSVSVGPSNSYTFANVTNRHTIWAAFMVTSHFDVVYVATNGLGVFPYTNWDIAAQSIQAGLDAATDGTLVLVSNGVYNTGGVAVHGALTNRVAITRAVTVQSVNGPETTMIQGKAGVGGACGNGAIRCVYMTNGALLAGFTLTNGFTLTSGDPEKERSGGGAYCDLGGIISNCVISYNMAGTNGGGVQCYLGGLVQDSLIASNRATAGGGGVYCWQDGSVQGCTITSNTAGNGGGGIYCGNGGLALNCRMNGNAALRGGGAYAENSGVLQNCTIVGNSATNEFGGGIYFAAGGTAQNCIVYYNTACLGANYYTNGGGILRYSCATPDPGGTSNLTVEPQLASASRLASNSPCIGKGSFAYSAGADIDGEAWLNPPSIGCDEVVPGAVTGSLAVAIEAEGALVTTGLVVTFTAWIDGKVGVSAWDFGDGVVASNQPFASHAWDATGDYAVVLWAYNESYPLGVAATVQVQVIEQPVHYVMATNSTPLAPYTNWTTAATNIQDAVDAAICKGALVLVSNGIYGVSTPVNLVKPITVQSLTGPAQTIVDGKNLARCFLLADSRAVVDGFTIKRGRSTLGGGIYFFGAGTVQNCVISSNSTPAGNGGAVYCQAGGTLQNCLVYSNSAVAGGGVYCNAGGTVQSCTLSSNRAAYGGGVYTTNGGTVVNTIMYFNGVTTNGTNYLKAGSGGSYANSCTFPTVGVNCVTNNPRFVNINARNYRLQDWSACIEKGTNQAWMSGAVDLDGRPRILWPSVDIGAYEWAPLVTSAAGPHGNIDPTGVVEVYPGSNQTFTITPDLYCAADVVVDSVSVGPSNSYTFADVTNSHTITATFMVTSHFDVVYVATNGLEVFPYTNWDTAARSIQEGLDAATDGTLVLVSNGVYNTGGIAVHGALTNRVAITRAVTVQSVTGPEMTKIQGKAGAGGACGDGAIRCVYMTNGAFLAGFTLTNGFTRSNGDLEKERSGGGAYCDLGGTISNCVISFNMASTNGGGVQCYRGGLVQDSLIASNRATVGGGGVFCWQGGSVQDCTIMSNSAVSGGGAYCQNGGLILGTTLKRNSSSGAGGGVYCYRTSVVQNCTIISNMAVGGGGGVYCYYTGLVQNCALIGNSVSGVGGGGVFGFWGGVVENCTLTGNSAPGLGGGGIYCITGASVRASTLSGNTALRGGGVYSRGGLVQNCLVSGNSGTVAGDAGAGIYSANGGMVRNCTVSSNLAVAGGTAGIHCSSNNAIWNTIIYFNGAAGSGINWSNTGSAWSYSNCCTLPTVGANCVTNDPSFLNQAGADYRLRHKSPCIDRGLDLTALGVTNDIDGVGRPLDGDFDTTPAFDIGAYEYNPETTDSDGDEMTDGWENGHGLDPTDAADALAHGDDDGFNNHDEYIADTDPTNAASYLRIAVISNMVPLRVFFDPSSTERVYALEFRTNLFNGQWDGVEGQSNRIGVGGMLWLVDSNAVPPRYYRVKVDVP